MCMHNYNNKDKLNGKKAEHVTRIPSIYYGNMLGLVSRPQAKTVWNVNTIIIFKIGERLVRNVSCRRHKGCVAF